MSAKRRRSGSRSHRGALRAVKPSPGTRAAVDNKRSGVYWSAGALLVFGLSYINSVTAGISWDESWFLQVLNRLRSGDVLYRDVFFGATPLSVYVGQAFTWLLGTEIWVVKAIAVLCFTVAAFLSYRIARQLDSAQGFPLLIIILLIFARVQLVSLYTPLADVLLLGCFSFTLSWMELVRKQADAANESPFRSKGTRPGEAQRHSNDPSPLGGEDGAQAPGEGSQTRKRTHKMLYLVTAVAAGLCFRAKQNLGLCALAALMLTVAVDSGYRQQGVRASLRTVSSVLIGFCPVCLAVLLPVWSSGGLGKLLEYGFLGKEAYVRYGGVSYLQGVRETMGFDPARGVIYNLAGVYGALPFLLPFLAATGLLMAWRNMGQDERSRTAAVTLFAGAALMSIYPIANMAHLKDAIPVLVIALAYAWYRLKPRLSERWSLWTRTGVAVGLIPGLVLLFWLPLARIEQPTELATLPHSRGALIGVTPQAGLSRFRSILDAATGGQPVFFMSRYAGFYYLITGLKNPTPFDFTYSTAFGRKGQQQVVASLAQRRILFLCIDTEEDRGGPLFPQLIRTYVDQSMDRYRDLGICVLYRAR